MEAHAGESIRNYLQVKRFPRISLVCKLVPVQYREYEYGLLFTLVMGLDYCCVTLVPSSETQGQLVGWKGFSWERVYRLTTPGSPRML